MTLDPDRDDVTVSKHYQVCCTHPIESAKVEITFEERKLLLTKMKYGIKFKTDKHNSVMENINIKYKYQG